VGARPNFVKLAPVVAALRERAPRDRHLLVHTGQHYDRSMSSSFWDELDMPPADFHLGVGSGSVGRQVSLAVSRLSRVVERERPDVVIAGGDVNSTLAAALAAVLTGTPLAHVEAGLRSFDLTMPEEVNRILTDHAADLLFTHSPEADRNLAAEGVTAERVHRSGNTMIDSLVRVRGRVDGDLLLRRHGVRRPFLFVTLHRPALVEGDLLRPTVAALERVAARMDVLFAVHPRTARALARQRIATERVRLAAPVSLSESIALQERAAGVLTDSGGIQEESTFLGVPCATLRESTDRPVTLTRGTNRLLGLRPERIDDVPALLAAARPPPGPPAGWDGRASARVAAVLDAAVAPRRSPGLQAARTR
jgi:UDP-N-acetylglucosamine 2-epimerase (non-hydrolysing)